MRQAPRAQEDDVSVRADLSGLDGDALIGADPPEVRLRVKLTKAADVRFVGVGAANQASFEVENALRLGRAEPEKSPILSMIETRGIERSQGERTVCDGGLDDDHVETVVGQHGRVNSPSMPISLTKEMIIMKTIQVTLLEELHARCKTLASARRTPLKEFFVAAIEAYASRIEARTSKSAPTKRGSR